MVAHVREGTAAAATATALVGVESMLAADARTAGLAERLSALVERGDTLARATLLAQRAVMRRRASVFRADATWDGTVRQLAHALRAPGANPATYDAVFREAPSRLEAAGFERELARGEEILVQLAHDPAVGEVWIPRFRAAQAGLREAVDARDAALQELFAARAAEAAFLRDVNHALDALEVDLFALFPSDRDTAATFLATLREEHASASKPAPAGPTS